MSSPITRNALILSAFALVCTAMIVSVQQSTKQRIQLEQDRAFARMLSEVLPIESYDNLIAQNCIYVSDANTLGTSKPVKWYRASKFDKPVAVIAESIAPDGYSGEIRLLVGIYMNGHIAGVRVTHHKETPGLGDKIEAKKHPWITQFKDLSLTRPETKKWAVKKDGGEFDAFAGATITPRAVLASLQRTLVYFAENQRDIFQQENACEYKP